MSSMEAPSPTTSPLDGSILKLPGKLDRLLHQRHRYGCILPKGVEDEIPLIKGDLEEIMAMLSNLDDYEAMMVRCWRKEVRELSYDMEDFIDQYEHTSAAESSLSLMMMTGSVSRRQRRNKSKTTVSRLGDKILIANNKMRESRVRAQELFQRYMSMYNRDAAAVPVSGSSSTSRCHHSNSTPRGGEEKNLDDHHAMKEALELSYDMENFIEHYGLLTPESLLAAAGSISVRSRRQVTHHQRPSRKSKTIILSRLGEKLRQRLCMANMIREFSLRAQEALGRYNTYKLDAISAGPAASSIRSCTTTDDGVYSGSSWKWNSTTSTCEDDVIVGISAAMENLQELLLTMHDEGHQQNLKVVSIVGSGGIGKTTVAMELYRKLGHQFDCRAFVRTSQEPDMRRIFVSMLSQIGPHQPPDNWTIHSLISTIRAHLRDKRYLIVVEDLCATSTWDIVKRAFPDTNCCSRILTTTEIEDLALQSCDHDPKYVYKMKPLGEDDSRTLFFSSIFGPQHECPSELREISHAIISKCGGLPLAIVTVAGVLSSKPGLADQWDYVNKSIGYSLSINPTSEGMKQVLDLSFNILPQHLKACILYTGLYEEDIIIWKDDLVNQWIAEGFIEATEGQDKKEIARSFFDRLISRKLILPVCINKNGEVLSCVVHRMVLNLVIRYKSVEENFVTAIHHSQTITTLSDKVRRLSLQFGNAEDVILPINMRLSQVRTLVFWGVFKCSPTIVLFHLLQVLILHFWGDKDNINFDLTRISELFRLRYLKVTSNVTLELGNKIRGLQSLETLTIDARVNTVPSEIVYLPSLLHFSVLPETDLPNGIGHMTSLHTLGYFDLSSNSIENVQSLSMLTNLVDLKLTCSTGQPENMYNKMQFLLTSILGRLSNLKSLTLVPRASTNNAKSTDEAGATGMAISGGFSSLSSAPGLLQSLEVSPQICIFYWIPKWIGQLHKLRILKIGLTKIDRDDVDVIRGLTALAVLSLYSQTKPAARIVVGKTGFPVIKYFKFKCCDPLLKFEEGSMPNLCKLKLVFNANHAHQHITIPVGIRYLSNLKELSAKIGGAGSDESHRRAIELAFRDAVRVHARCERVSIQCVQQIIGGKDDQYSLGRVEDYGDEEDSDELVEMMPEHYGEAVDTDADNRSLLSELHILLLLRNKLDNQCDDITYSIPIVDVYSYDPWNLESSGSTHRGLLLFFRPLPEARGVVPVKTPSGYWKVTGLPGYIYSDERLAVGMKRTMEFYHDHLTSGTKTKWKIKEFTAFQHATAGEICTPMMPRSEMSLCQLYTELAANPDCSPAGVQYDEKLSVKQNKIPAEEPSVESDIVQTRKHADKRKRRVDETTKTVVTIASPDVNDGYTWRKYGSKQILGSNYPRDYYKCTQRRGCPARKHMQRRDGEPILYDVCYFGEHSCDLQQGHSSEQGSETNTISGGWEAAGLPLSVPHAHGISSVEAMISSGSLTARPNPGVSSLRPSSMVTSQVVMSNPDDDGYSWTKCGQKNILGAKHPISYYRCAHWIAQGCTATKRLHRKEDADTLGFDAIYYGQHTCDQIAHSTDNISSPLGCTTTGSTSKLGTDKIHPEQGGL